MPKVNLGKDTREDETKAVIAAGMARQGVKYYKTLAQMIGVPESTLRYHINHIREMRLGEIWDITAKLRVPEEDKRKII